MQIFMSFMKGNQSNKYITALYCLFQSIHNGDPDSVLPNIDCQNAFSLIQQATGPDFRIVGKSLH